MYKTNKIKKALYVVSLFAIMIFNFGCSSDFLDTPVLVNKSTETVFKTETECYSALIGVYAVLADNDYSCSRFMLGDILSDDAAKGSNSGDMLELTYLKEFRYTPDNSVLLYKWAPLYRGINQANIFLQNIGNVEMNDVKKERFVAEVRFLRAIFHFDLVRSFGYVPIMDKTYVGGVYPAQSDPAAGYKFVIDELTDVYKKLPKKDELTDEELGRATYGAALGYLATTYAYTKEWGKLCTTLETFFSETHYQLVPTDKFAWMFDEAGENCSESIFEVQFANPGVEGYGNRVTVFTMPRLWGWGFRQPNQELYDLYEDGDKRKAATIMTYAEAQAIENSAVTIPEGGSYPTITDDQTGFYSLKNYLLPNERPASWADSPVNERVLRLADLYLLYAEALYHETHEKEAKDYLNKVRRRAFGDLNHDVMSSGGTLLKDVYKERRLELAMESNRYFDILRTDRYELLHPNFVKGRNEYFAIPQKEIDNSQGVLEQKLNY